MKRLACCLISFLVTILVIVGGVFGAGWYVYDRYAKEITGISYMEAWGVLNSLYGTNENRLITNSFDKDAEMNAVNGKLKELLYLDSGVEFDITKLIEEIAGNAAGSSSGMEKSYAESISGSVGVNNDEPFMSLLNTLKFDFSSLKNYDGSQHLFVMTDKQLGALMSEAVDAILSKQLGSVLEFYGIELSSVISVKEAKIVSSDNILTANEDTEISAVIKVETRAIAEQLIGKAKAGLTFLKGLLPKATYITLNIKPFGDGVPSFRLNDNSEKESKVLERLLNGILNYSQHTKSENALEKTMGSVDKVVKQIFAELNKYLNVTFAPSSMKMNPLQSMITALGMENVSDTDLLYMISYLMSDVESFAGRVWNEVEADKFFDDFKSKMPIDSEYDLNMNNFVTELAKIGNHIDINAMNFDKTNEEMRINMNYDALTGLINELAFGSTDAKSGLQYVYLRQITMPDTADAEEKQLITFLVEFDIRQMSGLNEMADGIQKNLLNAMIRENLFVEVTLSAADPDYIGNIDINGLGVEKTSHLFKTIENAVSILAPGLAGDISEQSIMTKINDAFLSGLEKIKGDENAGALDIKFTKEGVSIQSVYEIIKSRKNITEMEADDIRLVLKGVTDNSVIKGGLIGGSDENGLSVDAGGLSQGKISIEVSDAYLAHLVKNEVDGISIASGGAVSLEQILIADLSADKANNKLWNNDTLRSIIENNGMSEKRIMLLTVSVSLVNEIFNKEAYLTVIYDIDEEKSVVVINSMNQRSTADLQILIEKLSGASVDFGSLADDVVREVLKKEMNVNVSSPVPGITIPTIKFTIAELLHSITIENAGLDSVSIGVMIKEIAVSDIPTLPLSSMLNVYNAAHTAMPNKDDFLTAA